MVEQFFFIPTKQPHHHHHHTSKIDDGKEQRMGIHVYAQTLAAVSASCATTTTNENILKQQ